MKMDVNKTSEWSLEGKPLSMDLFTSLEPTQVLIDYGYPVLFSSRNAQGFSVLAFHVEELLEPTYASRHIVAPTTEAILSELEHGIISIRDALTSSWMWVLDIDEQGQAGKAVQVTTGDIPENALPGATTMISSELQPAITLRYIGEDIKDGYVPASVIKVAGESLSASLRGLVDYLMGSGTSTRGRRPRHLTNLYNLSAQRIVFNSLEIAFRRPQPIDTPPDLTPIFPGHVAAAENEAEALIRLERDMWSLLERGLSWVSEGATEGGLPDSDEEQLAILRAVEKLAPKTDSVEELAIGGKMIASKSQYRQFRLNREMARQVRDKRVKLEEKLQRTEETKIFKGYVRYVDPDEWTLMLRTKDEINQESPPGSLLHISDNDDYKLARDLDDTWTQVSIIAIRELSTRGHASPWVIDEITVLPGVELDRN